MTAPVAGRLSATQDALRSLNQALDAPRVHGALGPWRHSVSERMTNVLDCLAREATVADDGWLADRARMVQRERRALLGRLTAIAARLEALPDVDMVRMELKRLLVDVSHHVQKLHDLAYDDVEMEIGGSE